MVSSVSEDYIWSCRGTPVQYSKFWPFSGLFGLCMLRNQKNRGTLVFTSIQSQNHKNFQKNQISEFGLWFGLQKFSAFFSIFLAYLHLIRLKCINSDLKRIIFAIEINFVSNWAKHISVSRPPWDRNPKDPRTKYKPTPSLWESIKILYTKMPGLCIYKQKYRKFERLKY